MRDGQLGHAVERQPGLRRGRHGASVGEDGHEVQDGADGDDGQAGQRQVAQQRGQDGQRGGHVDGGALGADALGHRCREEDHLHDQPGQRQRPPGEAHVLEVANTPPEEAAEEQPGDDGVEQQHGPVGASDATTPAHSGAGGAVSGLAPLRSEWGRRLARG